MQVWDMKMMYENYSDATHISDLADYPSGLAMPLTQREIIGCALNSRIAELTEYLGYFECIRLILALWQTRTTFRESDQANARNSLNEQLTERQDVILAMVKEGKTNSFISMMLGYSESLIRQETIIIYKKLGVTGRRALISSDIKEK